MKTVLTALLALAVLAVGASTAHAGAMTLNASVKGAGQITAVSGGSFDCDKRGQELETDDNACDTAFYNAVFAVSLTLKATAPTGWKRSGWDGCDSVNDKGECVITGPIASRGYKTVKAIFEDTAGPVVTWDLQRHNGDSTIDLAWHADEPATFRCGVLPSVYAACTSPFHATILSQNTYSWDVEATDRNGSKTILGSRTFTDVQTHLVSAPSGRVTTKTAAIAFGQGPGDRVDGYECRIDGGGWSACSSPWNLDGLGDGDHTAEIRGFRDGSYEIIPASATWTVDTVAPTASLGGGPQGQVATRAAAFALGTTEPGKFQCRLDGAAFGDCSAAPSYADLGEGEHTFSARAVDAAGNVGAPVQRTWSVDTTPSVTTLAGPIGTTTVRTATLSFVAGDGARFECSLDGAAWARCTSPWKLEGLADGQHAARVRSIDDVGNVEAPKELTWTVAATQTPPGDDPAPGNGGETPKPTTGGGTTTPTGGGATTRSSAPAPAAAASTNVRLSAPVLSGKRKGAAKVDRRGRFTVPGVKIACPAGGACKVTATAVGGKGTATVAAGRTGTVRVTLGKAARRKRGVVRVTVTASGPGGTATAIVKVTLKQR